MNKEYVNLNYKLEYIIKNSFNLCLTHHHDINYYHSKTKIKFIHIPFAFNEKKFGNFQLIKDIDLGFSGVLQNLNKFSKQSDIRYQIMRKFYYCPLDLKLFRKRKYSNYRIFWNSIPRSSTSRFLSKCFKLNKYIDDTNYSRILARSKIFINTLSPMGLISPRYFECMASESIVFCEESDLYDSLFDQKFVITFKKDLSNFDEKFQFILKNYENLQNNLKQIKIYCYNQHTWKKRVENTINEINKLS